MTAASNFIYQRLMRAIRAKGKYSLSRRDYLDFMNARPENALLPDFADLWFLYRFVRSNRPGIFLEFGGCCSTVVIAHALADNGCGKITFGRR